MEQHRLVRLMCMLFQCSLSDIYIFYVLYVFLGGGGPIMGDLWALKGLIEEGESYAIAFVKLLKQNYTARILFYVHAWHGIYQF
jgi:hypothetical protein